VTYQAARAGLSAGASVGWQGLSLSLSGYDQRLPELAALVADSLRTFDVAPLAFERQRDGLLRQLRGADKRQPVEQAAYRRNLALETPRYTNEQLAAGLEKATLPQVLGLQRRLLPEVEVEVRPQRPPSSPFSHPYLPISPHISPATHPHPGGSRRRRCSAATSRRGRQHSSC